MRIVLSLSVVKFENNTAGRDFIVSDIHGCYEALAKLLDHVKFYTPTDRLFSVGDLIDRGPHSIEVLSMLKLPWFFSVRGNHEEMLIQHLKNPHKAEAYDPIWLKKEYSFFGGRQQFAGKWLNILERLPYVISIGKNEYKHYIVHAEILENQKSVTEEIIDNWSFSDPQKAYHRAVWGRTLWLSFLQDRKIKRAHASDLPLLYSGHTIVSSPTQVSRQIYLDGGAYLGFYPEKIMGNISPCLRLMDIKNTICWEYHTLTNEIRQNTLWIPDIN